MDRLAESLIERVAVAKSICYELDEAQKGKGGSDAKLRNKWKHFLDLLTTNEHNLNQLDIQLGALHAAGVLGVANALYEDDRALAETIAELEQATFQGRPMSQQPLYNVPGPPFVPAAARHPMLSRRDSDTGCCAFVDDDALSVVPGGVPTTARVLPLRRTRDCPMPVPVAPVTSREWEGVPPHIRCRLGLERVNGAISDINVFLEKKYRTLNTPLWHLTRSNDSLALHKQFSDVETMESRHLFWFSENDIRLFDRASFRADATGKSILNALRFLGRLSTSSGGGTIRYCLTQHQY